MTVEAISRLMKKAAARAESLGVKSADAEHHLMKAEAAMLNAYFQAQRDKCDRMERDGTEKSARRHGVTRRAINYRKQRARSEIGKCLEALRFPQV